MRRRADPKRSWRRSSSGRSGCDRSSGGETAHGSRPRIRSLRARAPARPCRAPLRRRRRSCARSPRRSPGTSATTGTAVAVEDERLHDLREAAPTAFAASAAVFVSSENSSIRASARSRANRATRSTGSGQEAVTGSRRERAPRPRPALAPCPPPIRVGIRHRTAPSRPCALDRARTGRSGIDGYPSTRRAHRARRSSRAETTVARSTTMSVTTISAAATSALDSSSTPSTSASSTTRRAACVSRPRRAHAPARPAHSPLH